MAVPTVHISDVKCFRSTLVLASQALFRSPKAVSPREIGLSEDSSVECARCRLYHEAHMSLDWGSNDEVVLLMLHVSNFKREL